jgi:hypothetical protein
MSLVLTNSYIVAPSTNTLEQTVSRLLFLTTNNYYSPGASDDGRYRIYRDAGQNCYVSTNFGQTWNRVATVNGGTACNSTGSIMYIAPYGSGFTYISTNYGATWTPVGSLLAYDNYSVATNQTGQSAFTGGFNADQGWFTSNAGSNWTYRNGTGVGTGGTRVVAMDSSGSVIVTGSGYISTNSGASWTRPVGTNINSNVAISGDATKILIADQTYAYILLSINGGMSFTNVISIGATTWQQVAISRDGTIMMARNASNQRYVSYNGGSTWAAY